MLLPSTLVARRFAGTDGGFFSPDGGVVISTALLAWDRLPAASRALTTIWYVVFGVTPVSMVVASWLPPTVFIFVPPLYTSYNCTPTLSVAASQAIENEVGFAVPTWCRFVGGLGGVLSTGPPLAPYTSNSNSEYPNAVPRLVPYIRTYRPLVSRLRSSTPPLPVVVLNASCQLASSSETWIRYALPYAASQRSTTRLRWKLAPRSIRIHCGSEPSLLPHRVLVFPSTAFDPASVELSVELVVTGRFLEISGSAVAAEALSATPPMPTPIAATAAIVMRARGLRAIPSLLT